MEVGVGSSMAAEVKEIVGRASADDTVFKKRVKRASTDDTVAEERAGWIECLGGATEVPSSSKTLRAL